MKKGPPCGGPADLLGAGLRDRGLDRGGLGLLHLREQLLADRVPRGPERLDRSGRRGRDEAGRGGTPQPEEEVGAGGLTRLQERLALVRGGVHVEAVDDGERRVLGRVDHGTERHFELFLRCHDYVLLAP